ncbi:hypothetical protein DSCA_16310 [Desulfosarcina alkanivorans]|uniref:PilZ domain-containing protein n=1 Tax=Desulfosarcina alkanivorans TaxID=571177 RepID=A0A5K7YLK6_9BACT|nr:PilZ domain-containing protein [Desulfosarcina alkanivorans]BBO67701.1 hypothetical protein DSCA_16310 [Desulfosarcina alkanivorans]
MLFFNGKEDMGLEASLKLLDLPPDATIDDANRAYADLHRMIDQFHQDAGTGKGGDRQEDMELLTCAYEKAVGFLSDQDPRHAPESAAATARPAAAGGHESTDLHFTINFNTDPAEDAAGEVAPVLPEPNTRTVEAAVSITARRLHQAESALPAARQAVTSAAAAVTSASRQHESARQASMDAVIAAKSAKSRALLLDIEVKRAMAEAIAVAEKARDRVIAARQAAREASVEADKAREQARRIRKSEETAAAEAVCAEDRLEKEKSRLKALTHTLIEARERMRMFQEPTADPAARTTAAQPPSSPPPPADRLSPSHAVDGDEAARQQIMSDLLDIEASLTARRKASLPAADDGVQGTRDDGPANERRRHGRLVYPVDRRPRCTIDGRSIPVLDLSAAGMRLASDHGMAHSRIVRGTIALAGRRALPIAGKVVRADDAGLGLRLVTRIGNHILDQERLRLSA